MKTKKPTPELYKGIIFKEDFLHLLRCWQRWDKEIVIQGGTYKIERIDDVWKVFLAIQD